MGKAQKLGCAEERLQELGMLFCQNGVPKVPGGGVHCSLDCGCVFSWWGSRYWICSNMQLSCSSQGHSEKTHTVIYTLSKLQSTRLGSKRVCVYVHVLASLGKG